MIASVVNTVKEDQIVGGLLKTGTQKEIEDKRLKASISPLYVAKYGSHTIMSYSKIERTSEK